MLNRVTGELIESLGPGHVVAPLSRWADTSLFEEAADRAAAVFHKAGAILPITWDEEDILVQEYPQLHKLAFIFARRIAGKARYHVAVIALPPSTVAELRMSGRWSHSGTVH